jgi:hypothetical protein
MAHCNFSHRFSFGFGLMATCFHGRLRRETPRGIARSARKLAQMRADFLIGLGLYGIVVAAAILTLV